MKECFAVTVLRKREDAARKPHFSLRESRIEDAVVLHCEGRLCFAGEARILAQTAGQILIGGADLILDLSALELLDSAGIGQLVLISMQAQALGRDVCIASASDRLQKLLKLTNVMSLFENFDSLDAALNNRSESAA
jgi:anti-sigma B factor antagonist